MDGHPVLTYSYTLYKSEMGQLNVQAQDTDQLIAPDKRKHPNYLGTIYYDQPEHTYSYTSDGLHELQTDEVREIIENIAYYRENPTMWKI